MTIEYRVRRVERFIVTRHETSDNGTTASIRQIGGEHDNFDVAYQVGYALARKEQEDLGLMPGDEGVIFPNLSIEDARASGVSTALGRISRVNRSLYPAAERQQPVWPPTPAAVE